MTREEYESLLQSDYWKGYSYSLIKERNFTCEDCGRSFPNQRNMLNVHHLVYREVNPWSYKPEEVVVCRECHQKRHGIYKESTEGYPVETSVAQPISQNIEMARESFEKELEKKRQEFYKESLMTPSINTHLRMAREGHERKIENKRQFKEERPNIKKGWIKYAIFAYLFLLLLYWTFRSSDEQEVSVPIETTSSQNNFEEIEQSNEVVNLDVVDVQKKEIKQELQKVTPVAVEKKNEVEKAKIERVEVEASKEVEPTTRSSQTTSSKESMEVDNSTKSTLELLEERNHANVVERAKRMGVSTEGSTVEILERINHANVVKRAEREGVSTEGSTVEILERINHANVVKRAEREGVSTEGTTIEILERINHANVVKRAEKAGVSTEGTTLEILERITRKELEKIR